MTIHLTTFLIMMLAVLILLILEAITSTVVFVWFAIGAFVAGLLSLVVDNYFILMLVFGIVSIGSLILFRQALVNKLETSKLDSTYIARLNNKGIVTQPLTKDNNFRGEIKVSGELWTAYSNETFKINEEVIIDKFENNKAYIKKFKEE